MGGGAFGPNRNFRVKVDPQRLFFSLKTSRPKAPISLDKSLFGIPGRADIYLFAENHDSVNHMPGKVKEAFHFCIQELPESGSPEMQKFATFLNIFYEGGFAYNLKRYTGGRGYIPYNVGIAGLGVVPSFDGQTGIATGYPYLLKHQFLSFNDTVPVTIGAITEMSPRHARYGLCFTRSCNCGRMSLSKRTGGSSSARSCLMVASSTCQGPLHSMSALEAFCTLSGKQGTS